MKKFLSLLCMIACVFGLTACGSNKTLTEYEQQKVDAAIAIATDHVIPGIDQYLDTDLSEYTAEEIAYVVSETMGIDVDGYAFIAAIESYNSAYEEIGERVGIGEATATIDDKQIIVHVEVEGEKENAEAEIIFSNDMFLNLESSALNPIQTMGNLMTNAALNTLIGMGTVFVVLILISAIIGAFGLIPKIQAMFSKKEEPKAVVEKAPVQAPVVEEVVEETDDLELVAVIAAAIAASEGAVSTDGFVVRSIRRRR